MEQEIIEFIKKMNKCWTEGDPAELNDYFHENMVAVTPMQKELIEGREACVAGWTGFAKNTSIKNWNEYGHSVQIYGNAAVVTYYYDIAFEMGGREINLSGRDMFTLVKENNKWLAVADHFSSPVC